MVGFGFIVTIVLLGALLGLFARQALATTEEHKTDAAMAVEQEREASSAPHFHAM